MPEETLLNKRKTTSPESYSNNLSSSASARKKRKFCSLVSDLKPDMPNNLRRKIVIPGINPLDWSMETGKEAVISTPCAPDRSLSVSSEVSQRPLNLNSKSISADQSEQYAVASKIPEMTRESSMIMSSTPLSGVVTILERVFTLENTVSKFVAENKSFEKRLNALGTKFTQETESPNDNLHRRKSRRESKPVIRFGTLDEKLPTLKEKELQIGVTCPECGKVFSSSRGLGVHKRVHKTREIKE